jgi:hypothetical protein
LSLRWIRLQGNGEYIISDCIKKTEIEGVGEREGRHIQGFGEKLEGKRLLGKPICRWK